MRTLTALLATAMFVSLAGASPAVAQEQPEKIDETKIYQEEDYALFGLDKPDLSTPDFDLYYRTLPSTPGGKPTIAITWDDGGGPGAVTHDVLDVTERYDGVCLTFFVNNRHAVTGTFQRILDNCHGIGSHGTNHTPLTGKSCSAVREQVLGVESFINALIDEPIQIRIFRPTFGKTNSFVSDCMAGVGYVQIMWNKDPRDWDGSSVAHILSVMESMGDGDIIVLHDSAGKSRSVAAWELFLERNYEDYNFVVIPGAGVLDPCETGSFNDVCIEDTFFESIEWMKGTGMTKGCDAEGNRFCPDDPVTRGQMAAFLVRGLGLSAYDGPDRFTDDNGNMFEDAIEQLAQAGVTHGCNPPDNTKFCPDEKVTRGQMAAFLVRALGLPSYDGPDRFVDDDDSVFEGAIERLAQAGITVGCNPPDNDRFCPESSVTRAQMAVFLKRALG